MPLLPETTRRIDHLVATAQAEARAPSLILGVVRGGALAHVAAAGGTPEPTPDTQYRIGSITKTLTATLVMQLRDEGRLCLDDQLDRHLPGTPVGAVTVRQLLGHASGLQREPLGPWWERAPGKTLDALLADLDPAMLVHPPYRTHHYSNLAYGLLAAVASRITGEAWPELVGKRLLAPLGMSRTTYQCQEPYARGYVLHPWLETMREEPRHDAGAMAPAGQLWSTVTDLARWAAFIADPAPEVIDPATVEEMSVPVSVSDPDTWSGGYGLGLQLVRRGERVFVGHGGSMPGYLAFVAVHRRSGTAALGYANAYNAPVSLLGLCGEAIETVLEYEPEPARPWRPVPAPAGIADLCGRWWFMGLEYQVGYDADAGELVFRPQGGRPAVPWRFRPEGTDRWRGVSGNNDGELLAVRRDPAGTPAVLDIATFEFTRDPMPDI